MKRLNDSDSAWLKWLQFLILTASLALNLHQWKRNSELGEEIRAVKYNDLSWEAVNRIQEEVGRLDLPARATLEEGWASFEDSEAWLEEHYKANRRWRRELVSMIRQAGSRMAQYRQHTEVFRPYHEVRILVWKLDSPARLAVDFLEEQILEAGEQEREVREARDLGAPPPVMGVYGAATGQALLAEWEEKQELLRTLSAVYSHHVSGLNDLKFELSLLDYQIRKEVEEELRSIVYETKENRV